MTPKFWPDSIWCVLIAVVLWVPLGRKILKVINGDSLPLALPLTLSLGMGGWGLIVLFLGAVGGLYLPLIAVAGFALAVSEAIRRPDASGSRGLESVPSWLPLTSLAATLMIVVSAVHVTIVLASSFAPEKAFDALNVYLPYVRDAVASKRLFFAPNNWNSSMPMLPLMTYILGFLAGGVGAAKLLNVFCYLIGGGLVYFFARRWYGVLHAAAAAALFWSSPIILYEATTALIDLPFTLFSELAVFAFLEWTRCDDRRMLWLSATGLGLSLGCKYHAVFWVAPLAALLAWHVLKVRKRGTREFLYLLGMYCLIALLLFLPWAVRAWSYTGNPVFPLANGFFKSPYFTPAMDLASRAAYKLEGVGTSLKQLAILPWTVTFHPQPFRGTLGIVFLFGAILAFFRSKTSTIRYSLVLIGAFFYQWGVTAQEIRYLLPLVPPLAILTAVGFLGVNPRTSPARFGNSWVAMAGAYVGTTVVLLNSFMSLPGVYPLWTREWTYWHSYQSPFPYLLGRQSAVDFLHRDIPSFGAYDFMNRNMSSADRVLLLNDASQFYSAVPTLYSFTVEAEKILLHESEEGVLRSLKESHITHVLLNYNGIAPLKGVEPRKGVYFFLDSEFQNRHLEPVYSSNNVVVYRLNYEL